MIDKPMMNAGCQVEYTTDSSSCGPKDRPRATPHSLRRATTAAAKMRSQHRRGPQGVRRIPRRRTTSGNGVRCARMTIVGFRWDHEDARANMGLGLKARRRNGQLEADSCRRAGRVSVGTSGARSRAFKLSYDDGALEGAKYRLRERRPTTRAAGCRWTDDRRNVGQAD